MNPLYVVGAGTAGMACALTAAQRGRRVVLLEKADRVGGTLHVSAGHMSGGGTQLQARKGIADDPQRHFEDVMRINQGTADAWMIRMACEEAPHTLDWLEELGIEWAANSPDIIYGHVPYRTPRTHFATNRAISILQALLPPFEQAVAAGLIEVKLRHRLVDLRLANQRVVGVVAENETTGEQVEFATERVVLTTGGYAANPTLFATKHPTLSRLISTATMTSQGEGIAIAERHGAVFQGAEKALSTNGGLELDPGSGRVDFWEVWAQVSNGVVRPPQEIYVDETGRRFMDETENSPDVRERIVERLPNRRFWVIFDENIRQNTPLLTLWWSEAKFQAAAAAEKAVWQAPDIATLARKTGLPADALAATLARYNQAVATQHDADFGRQRLAFPLQQPPYYAVLTYATNLITFGGLQVNEHLQVMHHNGQPIEGLYAAGEILGAGATSGNAFCGGMLLTPALSFGRILGRTL